MRPSARLAGEWTWLEGLAQPLNRWTRVTSRRRGRACETSLPAWVALRVRDGAAAEKAMSEHILSGGEYAVEMLRESGFWDNDSD